MDAKTYVAELNKTLGTDYVLVDGFRFPERIVIATPEYAKLDEAGRSHESKWIELPPLEVPKGTIFRDMLKLLTEQLKGRRGEAQAYVQSVKRI